jgi:glucan phosphorylase
MKGLVNGGINLSELDGWWAEAYTPEVGWALGDGQEHGDDPALDAVEADALYGSARRDANPLAAVTIWRSTKLAAYSLNSLIGQLIISAFCREAEFALQSRFAENSKGPECIERARRLPGRNNSNLVRHPALPD